MGLSCLADGAYQIFARAVVDLGGGLEVFVPAAQYRDGLPASALSEDVVAHAEQFGLTVTVIWPDGAVRD